MWTANIMYFVAIVAALMLAPSAIASTTQATPVAAITVAPAPATTQTAPAAAITGAPAPATTQTAPAAAITVAPAPATTQTAPAAAITVAPAPATTQTAPAAAITVAPAPATTQTAPAAASTVAPAPATTQAPPAIVPVAITTQASANAVETPSNKVTRPCGRIDSALNYDGALYLFSGNTYMKFVNKKEVESGAMEDWDYELPSDIEAASTWPGTGDYYFFKGPEYYTTNALYLSGPWDSAFWWNDFFANGIDAAGMKHGEALFFKGCKYISWSSYFGGASEEFIIPYELPCDIDAAWGLSEEDSDLVVLKGNSIWLWGRYIRGPFNINKLYQIKSINLCPPTFKQRK